MGYKLWRELACRWKFWSIGEAFKSKCVPLRRVFLGLSMNSLLVKSEIDYLELVDRQIRLDIKFLKIKIENFNPH